MDKKENLEKEIRFYFPNKKLLFLKRTLKKYAYGGSYYELTKMYNNPNPKYDFYNPNIDGRLRLRYSRPIRRGLAGVGLVSWKQRIAKHSHRLVRIEKEVEFNYDIKDIGSVTKILEDILHCPLISSYERRRHYYCTSKFSITLDQFPFGLMLEFEYKKNNISRADIDLILSSFNLRIEDASYLSCDDMYKSLCRKSKTEIMPDILFADKEMPKL